MSESVSFPVLAPNAEEQRALFRRWPCGVSVVVAESAGRRAGLTVSSLFSLSLEPQLVGISIARAASLHTILEETECWAASILGGEQQRLAQHFASSLAPEVLWREIAVRDDDRRLLVNAAGWLTARTVDQVPTGDHTLFVGELLRVEDGPAATSLAFLRRGYRSL
jgi:flavin reductase (DIM6/NTAB) family NADH-FMN oxidoreductase RutF